MQIQKDMTIHEVLTEKPETAEIFSSIGMHCLGCPMSRGETVEQAAAAHGVDLSELLSRLNK